MARSAGRCTVPRREAQLPDLTHHSVGGRSGVAQSSAGLRQDDERLPAQGVCRQIIDRYLQDRAKTRAWGMLNFGDWFGERRYNWGTWSMTPPGVADGVPARRRCPVLHREQAAWHLVDVDTCHAAADSGRVGG